MTREEFLVEVRAALAAAHRAGRLTAEQHREAKSDAEALIEELHFVDVGEGLIGAAADLAGANGLRGYDAVHLAGALIEAEILTTCPNMRVQ